MFHKWILGAQVHAYMKQRTILAQDQWALLLLAQRSVVTGLTLDIMLVTMVIMSMEMGKNSN